MLSKNYSTRNLLFKEKASSTTNNESRSPFSSISTCNTIKLNESFELNSYSNGKANFYDNDLDHNLFHFTDNNINNLFLSMDYDRETQFEIQKINNFYNNKKQQFMINYQQKKDTTIKDLCLSMGVDYQKYLNYIPIIILPEFKGIKNKCFHNKTNIEQIKELEEKYNAQYVAILNEIEKERFTAINNYKKQRNFQKRFPCLQTEPQNEFKNLDV